MTYGECRAILEEQFDGYHFCENSAGIYQSGNPELFLTRLQTLYANGDYSIQGDKELYFQNTMWAVFKVMGFYVSVERKTSKGRIYIVVKTDNNITLFSFASVKYRKLYNNLGLKKHFLGNIFQQSRLLLKSKKTFINLYLRNRCFGNVCFAT